MRRWWLPRKYEMPKVESNGETQSVDGLRESEKKLREAAKDRTEIRKVSAESRKIRLSNHFAEALEAAMRRRKTNG